MKSFLALILLPCIQPCISAVCNHDDVLRALLRRSTEASSFCATYLGHSSLSASVILNDITIVGGTFTQTYGPSETATLFKAFSKTITTKAVTTSYGSQVPARKPAAHCSPFPHLRLSVSNIPVNVNCEGVPTQYVSTDTITEATVFTATGGKKTTTLKVTDTFTKITSTRTIALPFPTICPDMALAEYIGVDGSPWSRSCSDSWGGSSTISTGTATSLDNCIDKCVANNQKA